MAGKVVWPFNGKRNSSESGSDILKLNLGSYTSTTSYLVGNRGLINEKKPLEIMERGKTGVLVGLEIMNI